MKNSARFAGVDIDRGVSPFKIDKHIPIPMVRGNGKWGKGYSATFRMMKPGDSVLLPIKNRNAISAQARLIFGNGKWICQKEGKEGYRVWRVK